MRLLVVEDEAPLLDQIATELGASGFAVDKASDGQEGLFLGREYDYSIAVIDLGLPKVSGIELIKQLRSLDRHYPVLILTARDNWQDKVEGLEAGADDYVVKPFHMAELKARINALMRRAAGHSTPKLEFGPIVLDSAAKTVMLEGSALELTTYEYNTLEHLMLHAGEVVSKTQLTEHLYDQDFDRDSNVIEVFVGRLRKKLDPKGHLKPIVTVRGQGYRFALQAKV